MKKNKIRREIEKGIRRKEGLVVFFIYCNVKGKFGMYLYSLNRVFFMCL